jgi:hypothetical protein
MDISLWEDCMPFTITVHKFLGRAQNGDPIGYADVSVSAYIEQKVRIVIGFDGQEKNSIGRAYTNLTTKIAADSLVTFPSDFNPHSRLPVLAIDVLADEEGIHSTVIHV